jgi:hypothetical protein
MEDKVNILVNGDNLNFIQMEDNLKQIMQPKTIKIKSMVVAPSYFILNQQRNGQNSHLQKPASMQAILADIFCGCCRHFWTRKERFHSSISVSV